MIELLIGVLIGLPLAGAILICWGWPETEEK